MGNPKCLFWILITSIWSIAILALAASPWLGYTFNLTQSLPGSFYLIYKGGNLTKGNLVAYRWRGGATYPAGVTFIKRIVGIPGDTVKSAGRAFWVNEQFIGFAKTCSKIGVPLQPAQAGVIAKDQYFVAAPNADSLDSRYALSGNVQQANVIGRA